MVVYTGLHYVLFFPGCGLFFDRKFSVWACMACYTILFYAKYHLKCLNVLFLSLYKNSEVCVAVLNGVHIK
jgi:hypothetical protein